MYRIVYTNRMKRDVRRAAKRGKDISKLIDILEILQRGEAMPEHCHDHQLSGKLKDFRECHIEPDWLLMYQIFEDVLTLSATATGSHSDLFGE